MIAGEANGVQWREGEKGGERECVQNV